MNKKSKDIIKVALKVLWADRQKTIDKHNEIKFNMENRSISNDQRLKLRKQLKRYLIPTAESDLIGQQLIKLNSLLDLKDKVREVVDLEQEMKKIQVKNNINVKEFAEIYSMSKSSQANYRGRLHDPLPYHQKTEGGKIVYIVNEVENWFDNQHR